MKRPDITMLHKYMCANRALEVVCTGQIYFPKAARFNDPFDCQIRFEQTITPEEFVEAAFRTYRNDGHDWPSIKKILDSCLKPDGSITDSKLGEIARVANEFQRSNAGLGVLSLSEDPLSILMWAHYAQQHQGACVGFRREPCNTLGDGDITHPVEYSDVYPEARFAEISSGTGSLSQKVLFTKARDWSYEKEWRRTCDQGDQLKNVPGPVGQVILGLRTSPEIVEKFRVECATKEIRLMKCTIDAGRFRLSAEDVPNNEIQPTK
ncbi:MAG: DUF2971 domain-containing protein [Kiritimatiellae bacterium]|jgi:hypothetical protein|nr:DUF2971 domain-containing protein [Kiritimatiellia bacterium]